MQLAIEGIVFEIDIVYYEKVEPQGKWVDSDWDAQGYEELCYNIISASDPYWEQVLDSKQLDALVIRAISGED